MIRQRGIALILVLLLSLILSLIGFGFQTHNRQMIEMVRSQQTKTQLTIELESQINNTFFELLTTDALFKSVRKTVRKQLLDEFGNKVDVELSYFSYSGRQTLNDINRSDLVKLLSGFFSSLSDLDSAVDSFMDWTDGDSLTRINGYEMKNYQREGKPGPRNGLISSIEELSLVNGFQNISSKSLNDVFTVYPVFDLDLMCAEPIMLSAYFSDDIVQRLDQAGKNGGLSFGEFSEITGQKNMADKSSGLFFMGIDVRLTGGNVTERERLDVRLAPFHPEPIKILRVYE